MSSTSAVSHTYKGRITKRGKVTSNKRFLPVKIALVAGEEPIKITAYKWFVLSEVSSVTMLQHVIAARFASELRAANFAAVRILGHRLHNSPASSIDSDVSFIFTTSNRIYKLWLDRIASIVSKDDPAVIHISMATHTNAEVPILMHPSITLHEDVLEVPNGDGAPGKIVSIPRKRWNKVRNDLRKTRKRLKRVEAELKAVKADLRSAERTIAVYDRGIAAGTLKDLAGSNGDEDMEDAQGVASDGLDDDDADYNNDSDSDVYGND